MTRHQLKIVLINANAAEFTGWGSRDLYRELTRKQPVYNTRTRSWVTTPARARDLAVFAETTGWDVFVTGATAREPGALAVSSETPASPEHADRAAGLW